MDNRELALDICVSAFRIIDSNSNSYSKDTFPTHIQIDFQALLKWYYNLDNKTKTDVFKDDTVLRCAMGYENYCLDIVRFKFSQSSNL